MKKEYVVGILAGIILFIFIGTYCLLSLFLSDDFSELADADVVKTEFYSVNHDTSKVNIAVTVKNSRNNFMKDIYIVIEQEQQKDSTAELIETSSEIFSLEPNETKSVQFTDMVLYEYSISVCKVKSTGYLCTGKGVFGRDWEDHSPYQEPL